MLDKYDGEVVLTEELTGLSKWNCILQNLFLLDAYKSFDYPPEEKARTLELAGKLAEKYPSASLWQDFLEGRGEFPGLKYWY